jgi:hypothetical protein
VPATLPIGWLGDQSGSCVQVGGIGGYTRVPVLTDHQLTNSDRGQTHNSDESRTKERTLGAAPGAVGPKATSDGDLGPKAPGDPNQGGLGSRWPWICEVDHDSPPDRALGAPRPLRLALGPCRPPGLRPPASSPITLSLPPPCSHPRVRSFLCSPSLSGMSISISWIRVFDVGGSTGDVGVGDP